MEKKKRQGELIMMLTTNGMRLTGSSKGSVCCGYGDIEKKKEKRSVATYCDTGIKESPVEAEGPVPEKGQRFGRCVTITTSKVIDCLTPQGTDRKGSEVLTQLYTPTTGRYKMIYFFFLACITVT